MKRYAAVVVMVGLGMAFWGATPASAQQVSSFEQLQLLVRPGDTIVVTNSAGQSTKGKIVTLTPALLRLSADKMVREFSQRDAVEIKQWRADSLANGAGIGAVSGAGFGAAMVLVCAAGNGGCDGPTSAILVGTFAAIGTGIGVGIDALIPSRRTIYRSSVTTLHRFDVKPIVTGNKKGAAVTFSF